LGKLHQPLARRKKNKDANFRRYMAVNVKKIQKKGCRFKKNLQAS
jgi:hypothetical protein